MRIIFIENIDPYQNSNGGVATYINNFSKYLNRKAIDSVLIGSSSEASIGNYKFNISEFINIKNKKGHHFLFILNSFFNIKTIKLRKDDYIFGQRLDVILPYILFFRKNKSICISHGNQSIAIKKKKSIIHSWIFNVFEKTTITLIDLLLTVDKKNLKYFKQKYPKYASKFHMIPIGVDHKKFYPMDKIKNREKYNILINDKVIMYIGRLEKEKNLLFLLDTFCIVTKTTPSAKLIIIGAGRQEKEIIQYVKEREIKNLLFFGSFDNSKIPELINCADLTVLCSWFEGSPTIIKESLFCNVPVVSTNVGDVKSVIEPLPNCFIAKNTPSDFADKIQKVLSNKNYVDFSPYLDKYKNEYLFDNTCKLFFSKENQ